MAELDDGDDDLDATSELPVLSEAEIVAAEQDGAAADRNGPDAAARAEHAAAEPPMAAETDLALRMLAALDLIRDELGALRAERPGRAEAEHELETLRERLAERETELERLQARLAERETELERLQARLAEREGELEAAQARLAALTESDADPRAELAALSNYITNRREHWEALETHVEAQAERVRELETELAQRVARQHDAEAAAARESARAAEYRAKLVQHVDRLRQLRGLAERPSADEALAADGTPGAEAEAAHAALVCLSSEQPARYAIAKPVMLIGRSADADIRIPTHVVSREHARLRRDGPAVYIDDLGSRNGVFVNSSRVDSHELRDGDSITIGETHFRYIAPQGP